MSDSVDVFISGAGPTGLLLAYQLTRLGRSVCIVDAADKASPDFPMYGRACIFYPRTLEMLDQLDLFDDLAQAGLASNGNATYADGKRVQGRGWTLIGNLGSSTSHDLALSLRLKYTEDILRRKIGELGVKLHAPALLVNFSINENTADEYKVDISYSSNDSGKSIHVKAKYIVGCDGGSSTVRKLAEIPFTGAHAVEHWVRIDGLVKTDLPDERLGFCAIESKQYGHVLWCALDHRATRVGYALTDELYKKYGSTMTAAEAVAEAKNAVAPFELEFEHVDWHTVYRVQQHVADRFQDRERILIAGDAAHTHSSAAAQGLNTGMGDIVNMGWRLAGVLNGLYKPEVLSNYSDERRAVAQRLIENDKVISKLMSGTRPKGYEDRTEDTMTLLNDFLEKTASFTTGLGISYVPSFINDVDGSYPPICLVPGHRAPDVTLRKPGYSAETVRLYTLAKNNGRFKIIVFAGQMPYTNNALLTLRADVDKNASHLGHVADFFTIVAGVGLGFDEALPVPKFGAGYWDIPHAAHRQYQIPVNKGAVVVLRPDGILGFVAPLDKFHGVSEYFGRLIK